MISLMEDVMFAYGTAPALAGKYQAGKHIIHVLAGHEHVFL